MTTDRKETEPANPTWEPTSLLSDAFADACDWHRTQARKVTRVPYITHLMGVSSLVIEAGGDEETAIAALLHDAIEDAGGDDARARIASRYGERVVRIVEDCTETALDPKPPWRQRKDGYIAHLAGACPQALLLSLCDKTCNTRNVVSELRRVGPLAWESFNGDPAQQLWWHLALLEAFTGRRSELPPLALPVLEEFAALVGLVVEHGSLAE